MSPDDNTSIWKKEITFRRKPKAEQGHRMRPAGGELTSKPDDKTSVWKKEITFRRKPKAEQGHRVPAILEPTVKPQSVAELLQQPAEHSLDPVVLPPVAPPAPPLAVSQPPVVPQPAAVSPPSVVPQPPIVPQSPPVSEPPAALEPEPEADQPADAVVLPPVTPPLPPPTVPQPPAAFEPEPEPEVTEEAEAIVDVAAPAIASEREAVPAESVADAHEEQPQALSRRERKDAQRAADRLAKEQRQQANQIAKQERKAHPAGHKRVVGLKIGASQIAAAQVVNTGGPRIVRLARMPLGRGVVVGGELREPEELAAALKTFFRKNKLPRTCVRLGISNNRIGVRTFEIPGIEDTKQLANAIRFRAQETLPIPLDEAVLDYRILEDRVDENGVRVRRVLLVVAHRDLVDRYVAACRKAGLKLIGIDLEAFALLRALGDPARPVAAEDAGLVCISIGHDRSTLAVSDGRICEFTRVLAWGGSALDVALARVLDLAPSEAEPIKRSLSLGEEGEGAGLDARRANEARRAMAAELQVFARELVASLRFYQEQPGSLGVGEILVTGGAAACGGLAPELERLIGVPVRVADPLARVKVPRKLRKSRNGSDGSLAVAVGLGIED